MRFAWAKVEQCGVQKYGDIGCVSITDSNGCGRISGLEMSRMGESIKCRGLADGQQSSIGKQ